MSSLLPPLRVSAPSPPVIVSLPPAPLISFGRVLPVIVSPKSVPFTFSIPVVLDSVSVSFPVATVWLDVEARLMLAAWPKPVKSMVSESAVAASVIVSEPRLLDPVKR